MFNNNKILALIPARARSKSIPHKNIKLIGNKPLIAYTIEEVLKSKYVDRVILSTDNRKIADIALNYGAEVPFLRPNEIAQDTSTSLSVILHTINYLKENENYIPDIIVFLQPTSPFRTVNYIDIGIEKIEHCDAVVGITEVTQHPYFMFKKIKNDIIIPFLDLKNRPLRRQDVPTLYIINASFFIAKIDYYKTVNERDPVAPIFNGKVKGIFMDRVSSIDINTEFDLNLAEFIITSKKFKKT